MDSTNSSFSPLPPLYEKGEENNSKFTSTTFFTPESSLCATKTHKDAPRKLYQGNQSKAEDDRQEFRSLFASSLSDSGNTESSSSALSREDLPHVMKELGVDFLAASSSSSSLSLPTLGSPAVEISAHSSMPDLATPTPPRPSTSRGNQEPSLNLDDVCRKLEEHSMDKREPRKKKLKTVESFDQQEQEQDTSSSSSGLYTPPPGLCTPSPRDPSSYFCSDAEAEPQAHHCSYACPLPCSYVTIRPIKTPRPIPPPRLSKKSKQAQEQVQEQASEQTPEQAPEQPTETKDKFVSTNQISLVEPTITKQNSCRPMTPTKPANQSKWIRTYDGELILKGYRLVRSQNLMKNMVPITPLNPEQNTRKIESENSAYAALASKTVYTRVEERKKITSPTAVIRTTKTTTTKTTFLTNKDDGDEN